MRTSTPVVADYLTHSRQRFAGMTLPDDSPVLTAIIQAQKNGDIFGLEALAKVCQEAHEMAELRRLSHLAARFADYHSQALEARKLLLC